MGVKLVGLITVGPLVGRTFIGLAVIPLLCGGCAASELQVTPDTWRTTVADYDGDVVCTDHGRLHARRAVIEEIDPGQPGIGVGQRLHTLLLAGGAGDRPPTRLVISEAPDVDWEYVPRPSFSARPAGVAVIVLEGVAGLATLVGFLGVALPIHPDGVPPWAVGTLIGGLGLGVVGLGVLTGDAIAGGAATHPSAFELEPCGAD